MHSPVFNDQLDELKKKCDIERTWNCIGSVDLETTTDSLITELLTGLKPEPKSNANFWDSFALARSNYPQYKEFYDRYDAVMAESWTDLPSITITGCLTVQSFQRNGRNSSTPHGTSHVVTAGLPVL